MNMRVNSTRCCDESFTRIYFCSHADDHILIYTIHRMRIARFSDSDDTTIFNTDICFYNTCMVNNHNVRNDCIEYTFSHVNIPVLPHRYAK